MSTVGARARLRRLGGAAPQAAASGLVVVALAGLGLAQPLLDLLGDNPTFFVASGASRGEIVGLALTVTLAIPLVLIGVEWVLLAAAPRGARWWHTAVVFALAATFGLVLARHLSITSDGAALATAAGVGGVVATVERRSEVFRLVARYLAVAPVLVLASFLFLSGSSRLIWQSEADVAEAEIGSSAPIVVLVLDELPLSALMTPDGTINAERYPNFARLAEEATWFRNASGVAGFTEQAVPALLTGQFHERGQAPTSIDHPRNIFTLVGEAYDVHALESVTQLCPLSICEEGSRAGGRPSAWDVDRFGTSLIDASVIWGHTALPDGLRDHLPSVDNAWAGFVGDPADALAVGSRPATEPGQSVPVTRAAELRQFIDDIEPTDQPTLHFAHVELPHAPWVLAPDGATYAAPEPVPGLEHPASGPIRWSNEPFLPRQAQQRSAYQLGHTDQLLGELLDQLDRTGVSDEALLAVVADHGHDFQAGHHPREVTAPGADLDEILRVPLFIRFPGQAGGRVDDRIASTVDLLPTIVDDLGIDTDWTFDGRSLRDGEGDRRERPLQPGSDLEMSAGLEGLLQGATRNHRTFGERADWLGVASVGTYGSLVGQRVDDVAGAPPADGTWEIDQVGELQDIERDSGHLPVRIAGTVSLGPDESVPDEILIALDGLIVGVGGGGEPGAREWDFSAVLAVELLADGEHAVQVLVPRRDSDGVRLAPLPEAA